MADYTPVYSPGTTVPFTASAAITGGQLVEVTGVETVGPAGAASLKAIGVAAFDAASGARVTVVIGKVVQEAVTTGTVTAGDQIIPAAAGTVSTLAAAATDTATDINNARAVIGVAITTATTGLKVQYVTR